MKIGDYYMIGQFVNGDLVGTTKKHYASKKTAEKALAREKKR